MFYIKSSSYNTLTVVGDIYFKLCLRHFHSPTPPPSLFVLGIATLFSVFFLQLFEPNTALNPHTCRPYWYIQYHHTDIRVGDQHTSV